MSLNNIQLHPQLLTGLYSHSLIEKDVHAAQTGNIQPAQREQPVVEASAAGKKQISFLGNNRRHISLLVSGAGTEQIQEEELQFLLSILAACKLQLDDVALINLQQQPLTYAQLQESLQSRQVILFGIEPLQIDLPMNFPQFQLQSFRECTYLAAPPLKEIEQDKAIKTKLWSSLRTLFGL